MDPYAWPALDYAGWKDTCRTLHLWLQVLGQIARIGDAGFFLTPRGLGTAAIPMPTANGIYALQLELLADRLEIVTSFGNTRTLELRACTASVFAEEAAGALQRVGVSPGGEALQRAWDRRYSHYDAGAVRRWWRVLVSCWQVQQAWRIECAPALVPPRLDWSSMAFELANGVSFRPGGEQTPEAGFVQAGQFVLAYEEVCRAPEPAVRIRELLSRPASDIGR
ncbi:MAG: DUF5996 family protein [Terriglobales bacterium]